MDRFVDLHQHVLWGIDDGPQTPEEMYALLQKDAEQGIGTVAATSHAMPGVRPFDLALYMQRLEEAQTYCAREKLPLRIIAGAEILYTPLTLSMLLDHKIPTIGNSEYILLEFWEKIDRDSFENAIGQLFRHGFIPIIAHIERYRLFWRDLIFLQSIKEKYSVCYQMNCDFALKRSIPASLLTHRLLHKQIVDIFATDAHNLTSRQPRMAEAFRFFSERENTQALELFVMQNQFDFGGIYDGKAKKTHPDCEQ